MDDGRQPTRYDRRRIFPAAHTPIFSNRVVLDGDFEAHSHDFIEVMVIGGGVGAHDTITGQQPLREGDIYVLRPGVWHAYRACDQLEVFNCCFGVEVLQRELAWLRDDPRLDYLAPTGPLGPGRGGILAARLTPSALGVCRGHLGALRACAAADDADNKADLIGRLLLILAQLTAALEGTRHRDDRRQRPVHEAVVAGMRLLAEDVAHPWSLAELADHVHINGPYLVRLFKLHTGLSPMAYLTGRRAERAATLLLRTNYPIARVGSEAGWPDPNYFARRFRAYFGISATAYRERHTLAGAGVQPDHTHGYGEDVRVESARG